MDTHLGCSFGVFVVLDSLQNYRNLGKIFQPFDILPVERGVDLIREHFEESRSLTTLDNHFLGVLGENFELKVIRELELISLIADSFPENRGIDSNGDSLKSELFSGDESERKN